MADALQVSDSLADAVNTAKTAVVRVEGRRRLPATGIIWSDTGMVVTANHVVRRDSGITVGLDNGTSYSAELIGRDNSTDIALLQLEATGLTVPQLAPADGVRIGSLALALGRPSTSIQATIGIVSAMGLALRGRQSDRLLQTDVLMYPGFSGGPLIDASGAIIGLNSSAVMHGASITIPNDIVSRVVSALQEHGHVRRGYLGVSTQIVRLQEDMRAAVGRKTGLLIVGVEPGSPADTGGLKIGDTIVQVGVQAIRHHEDLLGALMQADFDQKTPITIIRAGEIQTFNLMVGEQP